MNKVLQTLAMICLLGVAGVAQAKSIRATELKSSDWAAFSSGALRGVVIEFRQGDELPVTLNAEGDLLETIRPATSYIGVKRIFWLRFEASRVQVSFNGRDFRDLNEVLSGSVTASAGSGPDGGGLADGIQIVFKAYLK